MWYPIETAPEKTWVLVWNGEDMAVAMKPRDSWYPSCCLESDLGGVTHWMPLPEPPTED